MQLSARSLPSQELRPAEARLNIAYSAGRTSRLTSELRAPTLDQTVAGGPDADRAEAIDSMEIAIVGAASYVGGTNSNWAEDENIDRVQREQVARAIHAFANALGEPEQTVFKDHFLGGVRVADVATKVSLSPRSTERMLRDLREQLRTHLLRAVLS